MATAKREENSQETSVGVMDKKPNMRRAIVQISPEEKLNAEMLRIKLCISRG